MTITLNVEFCKDNCGTFSELSGEIFSFAMNFGREILRQVLEESDDALRRERDRRRYRSKGKRRTSVKTKLGVVEYSRNVYEDKQPVDGKRFVYLLDRQLEINAVGLMASDICLQAVQSVCESSYRAAARQISETTGLSVSPQGVWNIVRQLGEQRQETVERYAELSESSEGRGTVETKLLYEENDGVWLKLQGKDRETEGPSKEMKVGIAYDGVLWSGGKDGKQRRTLDNKVSYASMEPAADFRRHKEGIIANHYRVDEIQQRILNGDGAAWLKKRNSEQDILVLDKFHRNKKITECVKNAEFAQTLRTLLSERRVDELLECIEAQINSIEDEHEIEGLRELLRYYTENRESLLSCYDRDIEIVETREPGRIHHANLGSMESNVFTLIGNRMKDRRCCWSIAGANRLASLLCLKHTTGFNTLFQAPPSAPMPETNKTEKMQGDILSAARIPERIGHGYEFPHSYTFSDDANWGGLPSLCVHFSDLNFI